MNNIGKVAERKMHHGADGLHDGVEFARQKTLGVVDQAFAKAEDAIDEATDKGEEIWESVSGTGRRGLVYINKTVQKRPFRTLGIAALVGLSAGLLFALRSRK